MEKTTVATLLRILVDENIITEDQFEQGVEVVRRHFTAPNIPPSWGIMDHYYTCHGTDMVWYRNEDGSVYDLISIRDRVLCGRAKRVSRQGTWRWRALNWDPFHVIDEGISLNFYEALYEVQTEVM